MEKRAAMLVEGDDGDARYYLLDTHCPHHLVINKDMQEERDDRLTQIASKLTFEEYKILADEGLDALERFIAQK